MNEKPRVLVLCTGNSARSQMAEGILRHDCGERFEVFSAGTRPSQVRPEAIEVMAEIRIDLSGHRSKPVSEFHGQAFDCVLTVCGQARESCPTFAGANRQFHWGIEDPAAVEGDRGQRLAAFRAARDELRRVLKKFAETDAPAAAAVEAPRQPRK